VCVIKKENIDEKLVSGNSLSDRKKREKIEIDK